MNHISSDDLLLINQLGSWEISKEVYVSRTSFKPNFEQLNDLLDKTVDKCDSENNNRFFEAIFWQIPKSLSQEEKEEVYRKYLLKNWHHEHEEIVGTFQTYFNTNPSNVATLLKAIDNIPNYLKEDDFKYPYIRKIIYAIGAQPAPYNIQALEDLAQSSDKNIRELVIHQIEKRKKLGRWEAAKNTNNDHL